MPESTFERWWRRVGFAATPRREFATGDEIVYRVGGGASLALGSYFSPLRAQSVLDAETRSNVVMWGNKCRFVATYRLRPFVVYWVGPIAHGRQDVADRSATQIYIENPSDCVDLVHEVEALRQDLSVGPPGRA